METKTVYVDQNTACDVLKKPLDNHMNTVIDNGEKLISLQADEVLVTAVDLTDAYKGTCE